MGCVHQSKRFLVLTNGIEVQIIGNEKCDGFSDLLPPALLILISYKTIYASVLGNFHFPMF